MTPFLLYIARAGLYLGLFYAFYLLVMRRTTFFGLNRALLLAGSYLCLLLPLIRLRTVQAAGFAPELSMVGVAWERAVTSPKPFPWPEILLAVYVCGAACSLGLYLVSARKVNGLIRRGKKTVLGDCTLVLLENNVRSFSWGRTVVMSRQDLEQNPAIFTHERMHVHYRHTLDLLLFSPIQLLFWWNPLVWITREELRLLHEYQADEGVLQKGIDATQYQLLLVRKAVGEQRFSLASGFQHAKLKNRIAMMLKPTTAGWMRWSYLALIPVLATFMFACNPKKSTKVPLSAEETEAPGSVSTKAVLEVEDYKEAGVIPYEMAGTKPSFNGGGANEFSQWVNSQLKYPQTAINDNVQGRIIMSFTVDTDGSVKDVKVLRGIRQDLDEMALKVVTASPKWEPGEDQEGNKVPVTFVYPVIFQLR